LRRDRFYLIRTIVYFLDSNWEFKRRRVTHSRTPPDFGVMAKTSDELCAKYSLLIDDEFRKIIARRRRHLVAVQGANVARDFRRAKRFDRYLDQVLRNPDVFALLVKRMYRRAIGAVGKMPELLRSR
jgi:hypothetical protein